MDCSLVLVFYHNKGSCRGAVSGLLTCADVLPFNMVSNRPAALRGLLRANLLSEQVVCGILFCHLLNTRK